MKIFFYGNQRKGLGKHHNIWRPEIKGTPWRCSNGNSAENCIFPLKNFEQKIAFSKLEHENLGQNYSPVSWLNFLSGYDGTWNTQNHFSTSQGATYSIFNLVVKNREKLTQFQKSSIRLWILLINRMSEAINAEAVASFLSTHR